MENLETVFVLVAEPFARQDREDFFGGQTASALDERVGHLGPAIREPLERVLRGVLDHLIPRQRKQLRMREDGCQRRRGRNGDCQPY